MYLLCRRAVNNDINSLTSSCHFFLEFRQVNWTFPETANGLPTVSAPWTVPCGAVALMAASGSS